MNQHPASCPATEAMDCTCVEATKRVPDVAVADILADAKWTASRVGAPGSVVRARAEAIVALIAEVVGLRTDVDTWRRSADRWQRRAEEAQDEGRALRTEITELRADLTAIQQNGMEHGGTCEHACSVMAANSLEGIRP